jgi:hypothetical protein
MSNAFLRIGTVDVHVPVNSPQAETAEPHIAMELYPDSCRVWDSAGLTICGWRYVYGPEARPRFPDDHDRNELADIPHFDEVYRYLANQWTANRTNPLGQIIGAAVNAMDAAVAARQGARVYFARAASRIKIGWSRNVGTRLAQLQTANPDPIVLLATTPGGRALERQLHERFASDRVSGEWFDATDELLNHIAELDHVRSDVRGAA